MSWIDTTLAEYGRSLGIETLGFSAEGVASLRFDRWGELFIEKLSSGVLVYLARDYPRLDFRQLAAAATSCHWDENPTYPVNVALNGENTLVYSVTLAETEFDLPAIERVVSYLGQRHELIGEGAR